MARRNVRRGSALLGDRTRSSTLRSWPRFTAAVASGTDALHDAQHQRRQRVVAPAPRRARSARTAGASIVLQVAAERVHQQPLGDGADELLRMAQQHLLQPGHAVERRRRPGTRRTRRSAGRRRVSRHLPTASKFSIAKPIGSIRAWQLAHAGLARCCGHRVAHRQRLARRAPSVFSAGTFGGGGGGGDDSRFSSTHLPRSTGEVRVGVRGDRQHAALAQQAAARAAVRERDATEVAAAHVRNAVVLRQPLVEERVVGRQQIEHAAVLAEHAVDEQLGLARASRRAASRRNRETGSRRAAWPRCRADTATARRSSSTSACDRGSASMRRTCCSSTSGSFSCPAAAASSSSSSGMLLQRKNDSRDASSRSLTRYAVPAATVAGSTLDAEQELRADQQPLERPLDPEVEAAFGAPVVRRTAAGPARPRRSTGRRYARRASVERILRRARKLSVG